MISSKRQEASQKMSQTIKNLFKNDEDRDAVLYIKIKKVNKDFLKKAAEELGVGMTDVIERILDKMRNEK